MTTQHEKTTIASITPTDLKEIARFEERKKEMLKELLDEKLRDEGHMLVQKAHMGKSTSYIGTSTLRWAHEKVKIWTQLTLFTERLVGGRLIIDKEILEELLQREPKLDRQPLLTHYLIRQENRKFPPILVVASEGWVNDPDDSKAWDKEGRAKRSSIPIDPLDSNGKVALLDSRRGLTIYVIDGSHRLLGIRGLMEVIDEGRLTHKKLPPGRKKKEDTDDKAPYKIVKTETRDTLLNKYKLTHRELDEIAEEEIGIEFIPAVIKGETRDEGRRRVRSVFVHVNKTAQAPSLGEQVLLEEDDGFSIIARRVGFHHQLFHREIDGDRINWKSSALPAGSHWLTTIKTLRDIAQAYLGPKEPFDDWVVEKKEIALRPTDEELVLGEELLKDFLDRLSMLPSLSKILLGEHVDLWREFSNKAVTVGTEEVQGKGHLLMRPLGQLIIADVVGSMHSDENGPQIPLDQLFEKLSQFDREKKLENVDKPSSMWFGITFEPIRKNMIMGGRKLAVQMLRYLLGDEIVDEDNLLAEFRDNRTITGDAGEDIHWDHNGKQVTKQSDISLPPKVR